MDATINRISKDLYGNGQKGLVREFEELKVRCAEHEKEYVKMENSIEKLATSFSALARNDSNREAIRKALGKSLVNASLIVGIFGTIITLIITLM